MPTTLWPVRAHLPNSSRNTLPINPINDVDATALKRINFTERLKFEFQAQVWNVLNHSQYVPGTINNINSTNDNRIVDPHLPDPRDGFFQQSQGDLLEQCPLDATRGKVHFLTQLTGPRRRPRLQAAAFGFLGITFPQPDFRKCAETVNAVDCWL